MEKLSKILKVVLEYWLFITLGLSGIGAVITGVHNYYVMPQHVEPTVRDISYQLYMDSAAVWEERRKLHAAKGFRGKLSELIDIPKDEVADSISAMYNGEESVYMSITFLMDEQKFQSDFNTTIILMTTEPVIIDGINFRVTANGGLLYLDDFEKWWSAYKDPNYGAYFYSPSYTNGERIKCE